MITPTIAFIRLVTSAATLAQIPAPTPGSTENFLWTLGALLFIVTLIVGLWLALRSKPAEPANETLGQNYKGLSQRVYSVEGSVLKLHDRIDNTKDQFAAALSHHNDKFTAALTQQTLEINSAGERREKLFTEQFREIAASLARLDERSKRDHQK